MKSLLSDNFKFKLFNIDNINWLNYISKLEKKFAKHFKTLENNKKISDGEFKSISLLVHTLHFCMDYTVSWDLILSALTVNDCTAKDSYTCIEECINFDV